MQTYDETPTNLDGEIMMFVGQVCGADLAAYVADLSPYLV
jgi:hypothetical protein